MDQYQIREARIRSNLRQQFREGHVFRCDEVFMIACLKRGLIGMDGFKFCEVEEAKRNRALMVSELLKNQKGEKI